MRELFVKRCLWRSHVGDWLCRFVAGGERILERGGIKSFSLDQRVAARDWHSVAALFRAFIAGRPFGLPDYEVVWTRAC